MQRPLSDERRRHGCARPRSLPRSSRLLQVRPAGAPWQRLYFLPEPHGHGALRDGPPVPTAWPGAGIRAPAAGDCGPTRGPAATAETERRRLLDHRATALPAAPSIAGDEYCSALRRRRSAEPLGVDLHRPSSSAAAGRRSVSSTGAGVASLDLDLEVEQEADGLLLDAVEHLAEHVEALALVLHQRVALGVRAQADALLQVVHLVQVLAPLAVDHLEQHLRARTRRITSEVELLLAGRRTPSCASSSSRRLEELGVDLLALAAGLLLDVLDGDADRVELLEAGPELVEVPVLGVPLGGGALDVRR